jgi:hypothetical protein
MICLTGDLHHASLGINDQKYIGDSALTEARIAQRYVKLLKKHGVKATLCVCGLWYPIKGDVYANLLVTGTINLASISTLLVAYCYWECANNWGAAAAAIIGGALIPIACLVIEQVRNIPAAEIRLWPAYSGIAAFVATAVAMVVGSLLKPMPAQPAPVKPQP